MGNLGLVTIPFYNVINARDPQEFVLSKNNYLKVVGGYASALIKLDTGSMPSAAQTVQLSWPQGIANWTFVDYDQTSKHLPLWDGMDALSDYARKVFYSFASNPNLLKDFVVQFLLFDGTYAYISVTARQRGTQYNLTSINTSTLIISTTATLNDNAYADDQLNFYMDIISNLNYEPQITHLDDLVAIGEPDPDSNITTYTFYELPALLASSMGCDTDFPFSAFFYNSKNWCFANFLFFTSNVEGNVLTNEEVPTWLATFPALDSANGAYGINASNFSLQDPTTFLVRWMCRRPASYLIDQGQPLWLTIYLLYAGVYTYDATVTFDDGSTSTGSLTQVTYIPGTIGTFPAGYDQMYFDVFFPTKNPVKIDIVLSSSLGQYSEQVTYYYDSRFSLYTRYFLMQNSAGGYDTLRCRGVNEFSTKYTRQTAQTVRTSETTPDQGTIQMTFNKEERIWTMRTGWLLNLAELQWLRELLMTQYAAEIMVNATDSAGDSLYIPVSSQWKTPLRSIIIMQDTVKQYKEDDGMWALEWKMKYADDQYTAGDDGETLELYMDNDICFNITVQSLSAGCNITITTDVPVTIYWGGDSVSFGNTYTFSQEMNVEVRIVGYQLTSLQIWAYYCDVDITVTKISSPSLTDLQILAFGTIYCTYLMDRLPMLPLTNLELECNNGDLPIDRLLQLLCVNYDSFATLSIAILTNNVPSADGEIAKNYLIAQGVYVFTN